MDSSSRYQSRWRRAAARHRGPDQAADEAGTTEPSTSGPSTTEPGATDPSATGAGMTDAAMADAAMTEAAREIVLRQLTASAKSRQQLEDKLADRGIAEHVARAVLDRFEEVNLVNDREFAAMYVRSRAQSRKLARSALRRELADRGINGELAEESLAQRTDEDEAQDARELVRKKMPSQPLPRDRAQREKLTRRLVSMLARKGYAPSLAFTVVKDELGALPDELPEDYDA